MKNRKRVLGVVLAIAIAVTSVIPMSLLKSTVSEANTSVEQINNADLMPEYVATTDVTTDGNGTPDWVKSAIIAQVRLASAAAQSDSNTMYTGTIANGGGEELLNHYQEMGVNCLWLTPVNDTAGIVSDDNYRNGGYSNLGIETIDSVLTGTTDYTTGWQVFKEFVDEAHERNIHIVLDVVTWGVADVDSDEDGVYDAPLYQSNPEYFHTESGYVSNYGLDYNWNNANFKEYYISKVVEIARNTGIDGFRFDCEPLAHEGTAGERTYAGYEVVGDIRNRLETGDANHEKRHLLFMSEGENTRSNGGQWVYDTEQFGVVYTADTENYTPMNYMRTFSPSLYVSEDTDIVTAIQSGLYMGDNQTPESLGSDTDGTNQYYTYQTSIHDHSVYAFENSTLSQIAYNSFYSPYIPIFYMGEEIQNGNRCRGGSRLFHKSINYGNLETNADIATYFEEFKEMIRVRLLYPDIFTNFALNHRDSNIVKVSTNQSDNLQAYARYTGEKAVLVVPNNIEEVSTDFTVTIPFSDMSMDITNTYIVSDITSGEVIVTGTGSEITTFNTTIAYDELGLYEVVSAASKVEEMIDKIGSVTTDSLSEIRVARASYSALDVVDKADVSNLNILIEAERTYMEQFFNCKSFDVPTTSDFTVKSNVQSWPWPNNFTVNAATTGQGVTVAYPAQNSGSAYRDGIMTAYSLDGLTLGFTNTKCTDATNTSYAGGQFVVTLANSIGTYPYNIGGGVLSLSVNTYDNSEAGIHVWSNSNSTVLASFKTANLKNKNLAGNTFFIVMKKMSNGNYTIELYIDGEKEVLTDSTNGSGFKIPELTYINNDTEKVYVSFENNYSRYIQTDVIAIGNSNSKTTAYSKSRVEELLGCKELDVPTLDDLVVYNGTTLLKNGGGWTSSINVPTANDEGVYFDLLSNNRKGIRESFVKAYSLNNLVIGMSDIVRNSVAYFTLTSSAAVTSSSGTYPSNEVNKTPCPMIVSIDTANGQIGIYNYTDGNQAPFTYNALKGAENVFVYFTDVTGNVATMHVFINGTEVYANGANSATTVTFNAGTASTLTNYSQVYIGIVPLQSSTSAYRVCALDNATVSIQAVRDTMQTLLGCAPLSIPTIDDMYNYSKNSDTFTSWVSGGHINSHKEIYEKGVVQGVQISTSQATQAQRKGAVCEYYDAAYSLDGLVVGLSQLDEDTHLVLSNTVAQGVSSNTPTSIPVTMKINKAGGIITVYKGTYSAAAYTINMSALKNLDNGNLYLMFEHVDGNVFAMHCYIDGTEVFADGTTTAYQIDISGSTYLTSYENVFVGTTIYQQVMSVDFVAMGNKNILPMESNVILSNQNVKAHGITDFDSNSMSLEWSASGVEFNFSGTEAWVELTASDYVSGETEVWMSVYVNGEFTKKFLVSGDTTWYPLCNDMESTEITNIKLLKVTEKRYGTVDLSGIHIEGAIGIRPDDKAKKALVIGDSITAGNEILSDDATVKSALIDEDATYTYGYLAAEKLGADIDVLAYSGVAVSYDRGYVEAMPKLYQSLNLASNYDYIIINLGTNDRGQEAKNISSAVVAFLEVLKNDYPSASIVWAYGLMSAENSDVIEPAVKGVSGRTYYCQLPTATDLAYGAHPMAQGHKNGSQSLFDFIMTIVRGDFNFDGTVDELDSSILRNVLVGKQTHSDDKNEDMNYDGNIDVIDLVRIKKIENDVKSDS